jgi:hypothetical protein
MRIDRDTMIDMDKHSVYAFLNFYEELAWAVCNDLVDAELCKRFFKHSLTWVCNRAQAVFDTNPRLYPHLRDLAAEWGKPPDPIIRPYRTNQSH